MLDHDSIFGRNFVACRKNIRPFVHSIALDPLGSEHSDIESDGEIEAASTCCNASSITVERSDDTAAAQLSDCPRPSLDPVIARMQLNAKKIDAMSLERWLLDQLARWERKIDRVATYQDQVIVRSLFLHTLRPLKVLSAQSTGSWGTVVALADMDDWESGHTEEDIADSQRIMGVAVDAYKLCSAANDVLAEKLAGENPHQVLLDTMQQVVSHQAVFLARFSQKSDHFRHSELLMRDEAIYTDVIAQGCGDAAMKPAMTSEQSACLGSKHHLLLEQAEAQALQLRSWQVQAELLPGAIREVLTDWQIKVFRDHQAGPKDNRAIALTDLRPQPVISQGEAHPDAVHGSLNKLFGEVRQVQKGLGLSVPSPSIPVPTSTATPEQSAPRRSNIAALSGLTSPNLASPSLASVGRLASPNGTPNGTVRKPNVYSCGVPGTR